MQLCKNYANRNCIEKSIYNTSKKNGATAERGGGEREVGVVRAVTKGFGKDSRIHGRNLTSKRDSVIMKKSVRIMQM